MKRQRGRNRGGGGGKPQQNANRAFDSNGPEGIKVRGNAQHVFEKYQQLARDANAAGDRVLAENYLQHAEHYFRLLRAIQPQRPASEILGRDQFASGFDIDFEDESGAQAQPYIAEDGETSEEGVEARGERAGWQERPREDRSRDDRNRDDRNREGRDRDRGRDRWRDRDDRPRGERDDRRDRDDRPRDERPRDERPRDERPRDDRPRDDRPRDERPRDERPRDERPRDDRPRDDRPRGDREDRRERGDRNREERPERDPLAVVEPQAQPPLVAEERASPMLRDADGGASHAPAFLQQPATRPEAADDEAPARRPRRRRAPRSFEGDAGPPSETEEA
jgi:hypothetical protein